jgi:hypothetical protein
VHEEIDITHGSKTKVPRLLTQNLQYLFDIIFKIRLNENYNTNNAKKTVKNKPPFQIQPQNMLYTLDTSLVIFILQAESSKI